MIRIALTGIGDGADSAWTNIAFQKVRRMYPAYNLDYRVPGSRLAADAARAMVDPREEPKGEGNFRLGHHP